MQTMFQYLALSSRRLRRSTAGQEVFPASILEALTSFVTYGPFEETSACQLVRTNLTAGTKDNRALGQVVLSG
jgi:hypothetical protein